MSTVAIKGLSLYATATFAVSLVVLYIFRSCFFSTLFLHIPCRQRCRGRRSAKRKHESLGTTTFIVSDILLLSDACNECEFPSADKLIFMTGHVLSDLAIKHVDQRGPTSQLSDCHSAYVCWLQSAYSTNETYRMWQHIDANTIRHGAIENKTWWVGPTAGLVCHM